MADPPDIAVVLPIGPKPVHRAYLDECLASLCDQTVLPAELVIVDDGGPSEVRQDIHEIMVSSGAVATIKRCRVHPIAWTVGPAAGWNIGIAEARSDLCLMMGGDDWLEPNCVEELGDAWIQHKKEWRGYYSLTVKYDDDRPAPIQDLPCNAAMVHKRLWRHIGGFPIETASGACDAALISIMLAHPEAGRVIQVAKGKPLYNVRVHAGQDTAQRQPWQAVVHQTRDILTALWKPSSG